MKVCIVGSGSQGTGLAGLLAMEPDVEKLVIADYSEDNLEAAERMVRSLGNRVLVQNIEKKKVDAADIDAVAGVIHGCDIVFQCIIPKFNIPVMRACLCEHCHYLDLFASPFEEDGIPHDETIGAQFELDEAFQKEGILALPSVGMSPGWTSLSAQYMIDQMDTVDSVMIRWGDFLDTDEYIAPVSPYVVYHEWFGAPGPVRMADGKCEKVDLLESEETFTFPEPIGERKIYTVSSHPDVVLIPKFAGKPVRICEEKGGIFLGRRSMEDVWIRGVQDAVGRQGEAVSEINMLDEFEKALIPPIEYSGFLQAGKIRDHAVCFSCEAVGTKDGNPVRHICYYTSTLDVAVKHLPYASPAVYGTVGGLPIALVLAIGRNKLIYTGVRSVGDLRIAPYLNAEMARRGQIITERIERTSCAQ